MPDKIVSPSAFRAIDLFELFARKGTSLSIVEISQSLGMTAGRVSSLVKEAEARGYIRHVPDGQGLYPTGRLQELAASIGRNDDIAAFIEPMMVSLRDQTGETIILGCLIENEVIYLKVVEGIHAIRYKPQTGDRKPLHSSSIGKALLSARAPDEVSRLLDVLPLEATTDRTITDPAELAEEIWETKRRGYARTMGEGVADVMAIAWRFDRSGVTYGVAVSGPMPRLRDREAEMADALLSHLQVLAS